MCVFFVFVHFHALKRNEDPQHLFVHLGKTATNETDAKREQTFTVEKVILHHRFNISSSFDNDIGEGRLHIRNGNIKKQLCSSPRLKSSFFFIPALLKISGEDGKCAVKSASVRTVCLPPANTQLPVGFQCSIAGYGREKFCKYWFSLSLLRHHCDLSVFSLRFTSDSVSSAAAWANSKHLKEAEVSLISRIDCTRESDYNLTNNMICAGSQDWTRDACKVSK